MRRAAAEQSDEGQDGVDDAVRSCALTPARRPKDELIRFVLGPDGAVVPDLKEKLPGRGVWVTAAYDTVAKAAKRNVFARALKTEAKVPEDLAGQVDRLLAGAALSAEDAVGSCAVAGTTSAIAVTTRKTSRILS